MSHYTCLVILPATIVKESSDLDPSGNAIIDVVELNSEELVRPYLEAALALFDENMDVPEYDTPCYCVGMKAKSDARAQADAEAGSIDALRKSFKLPHPNANDMLGLGSKQQQQENNAAWQAHIAPRVTAEQRIFDAHPLKDIADLACPDCHGTGTRRTTYNPLSKWDWWTIGGRWNGSLTEDGRNVFPLTDLKHGWSVFAILDPKGGWHAEGEMGWWGMVHDEQPDWERAKYEIASAFPEHVGVLVDLHI